jgi:hypothetical protein
MDVEDNPRTRTKEHGYSPLYTLSPDEFIATESFIRSIIGEEDGQLIP